MPRVKPLKTKIEKEKAKKIRYFSIDVLPDEVTRKSFFERLEKETNLTQKEIEEFIVSVEEMSETKFNATFLDNLTHDLGDKKLYVLRESIQLDKQNILSDKKTDDVSGQEFQQSFNVAQKLSIQEEPQTEKLPATYREIPQIIGDLRFKKLCGTLLGFGRSHEQITNFIYTVECIPEDQFKVIFLNPTIKTTNNYFEYLKQHKLYCYEVEIQLLRRALEFSCDAEVKNDEMNSAFEEKPPKTKMSTEPPKSIIKYGLFQPKGQVKKLRSFTKLCRPSDLEKIAISNNKLMGFIQIVEEIPEDVFRVVFLDPIDETPITENTLEECSNCPVFVDCTCTSKISNVYLEYLSSQHLSQWVPEILQLRKIINQTKQTKCGSFTSNTKRNFRNLLSPIDRATFFREATKAGILIQAINEFLPLLESMSEDQYKIVTQHPVNLKNLETNNLEKYLNLFEILNELLYKKQEYFHGNVEKNLLNSEIENANKMVKNFDQQYADTYVAIIEKLKTIFNSQVDIITSSETKEASKQNLNSAVKEWLVLSRKMANLSQIHEESLQTPTTTPTKRVIVKEPFVKDEEEKLPGRKLTVKTHSPAKLDLTHLFDHLLPPRTSFSGKDFCKMSDDEKLSLSTLEPLNNEEINNEEKAESKVANTDLQTNKLFSYVDAYQNGKNLNDDILNKDASIKDIEQKLSYIFSKTALPKKYLSKEDELEKKSRATLVEDNKTTESQSDFSTPEGRAAIRAQFAKKALKNSSVHPSHQDESFLEKSFTTKPLVGFGILNQEKQNFDTAKLLDKEDKRITVKFVPTQQSSEHESIKHKKQAIDEYKEFKENITDVQISADKISLDQK